MSFKSACITGYRVARAEFCEEVMGKIPHLDTGDAQIRRAEVMEMGETFPETAGPFEAIICNVSRLLTRFYLEWSMAENVGNL